MRTFLQEGVVAAASSDAPVVPLDPAVGLGMMMNRIDISGQPIWPEEAIGLDDALRAYTVNGAFASFEERQKGTITPGKLGDVAVFETDLSRLTATEIGSVRIDHTILGGDLAYSREGA
jgi:predicted amidohydrolase YtcJ